MKVIRRRWTETDDSILRQQYDHTREGTQRIASRLDRTPAAVKERAVSLGITKPGHSRRAWSEQDDEMLVQLLGHYQPRTVATKMKRSISSVRARAAKLGASARMRDGWHTQSEAAAIMLEIGEYPILLTRESHVAMDWLRSQGRGQRRFGLVASSTAKRLRAEGFGVSLNAYLVRAPSAPKNPPTLLHF